MNQEYKIGDFVEVYSLDCKYKLFYAIIVHIHDTSIVIKNLQNISEDGNIINKEYNSYTNCIKLITNKNILHRLRKQVVFE